MGREERELKVFVYQYFEDNSRFNIVCIYSGCKSSRCTTKHCQPQLINKRFRLENVDEIQIEYSFDIFIAPEKYFVNFLSKWF